MNTTVAIVGTHEITRKLVPFQNNSIDIWVFNNEPTMPWCVRADAVFDIHPPGDIARRAVDIPSFGKYLSEKKGVPIYTPMPIPDCPDNVVYPMEEVVNHLLPNFLRGEKPNAYFTSGPCYAVAMALHLGYKRIEFYGIEMENNTEYLYQRDGIGLWCGIAAGMGVQVAWSERSMMFYAPPYGYTMNATTIDREAFEARASELAVVMETTHAEFNRQKGILDAITNEFLQAQADGLPPDHLKTIAVRLEDATNAYEQAIANHAFVNGQYVDSRSWQARVEKVLQYNGKALEIQAQKDEKWGRLDDKLELLGRQIIDE